MRRLYRRYVRSCEIKNIFWNLSLEQFQALTSAPCAYCDKIPAQKARSYIYNGIDRVDNSRGYLPQNCVSACKECNFLKRDNRLTFDEMRAVAQALKAHRAAREKSGGEKLPPPQN